jgi:hypothetical protein
MEQTMESGDLIGLAGIFVSALVAIVSISLTMKRHREQLKTEQDRYEKQLEREDKIREEDHRRELERSLKHREDMPQIEFDISCNLVGIHGGQFVVELLLALNNKGHVKQDIRSIKLRVRGIRETDELSLWKRSRHRVEFPHKLFETEVIPKGYGFIFVEPNVRQTVSFTTGIDGDVRFVAARAEFSYGQARKGSRGSKHSVERVFRLGMDMAND